MSSYVGEDPTGDLIVRFDDRHRVSDCYLMSLKYIPYTLLRSHGFVSYGDLQLSLQLPCGRYTVAVRHPFPSTCCIHYLLCDTLFLLFLLLAFSTRGLVDGCILKSLDRPLFKTFIFLRINSFFGNQFLLEFPIALIQFI